MSAWEQAEWMVFEGDFGPLTLHERLDQLVAQLTWAAAGREGRPRDYLPDWRAAPKFRSDDEWLTLMASRGSG